VTATSGAHPAATAVARIVWPLSAAMDRAGAIAYRYRRPIRDGLILVGVLRMLFYYVVQDIKPWTFWGIDARAYWGIDLAHPYVSSTVGEHSKFLYSPAFAQLFAPVSLLPYEVYLVLWTVLLAGVALWLARPWPWILAILCLPVSYEVLVGNIHLLIAAAVVLAFRRPWIYAFPMWTKLTPIVGVGWWFVRAEWRKLAIALAAIAVVGVISVLLSPSAWADWLVFLRSNADSNDFLLPRAILAAAMVAFGGLTGRRWLVAVAVWFSLPVLWINSWAVLLAVIRLRDRAEAPAWLPAPLSGRDQLRDVQEPVGHVARN
jgi:glycosyl transferase family 87